MPGALGDRPEVAGRQPTVTGTAFGDPAHGGVSASGAVCRVRWALGASNPPVVSEGILAVTGFGASARWSSLRSPLAAPKVVGPPVRRTSV